jgi:dihydrodipicolinate synthase/N-acetylneuraminate lyase
MGLQRNDLPARVAVALAEGVAIPAHPLALDRSRRLDERRQRALSRYYIDAGAGGLAVGVHTTQFAIREHGLYEPVLRLAIEEANSWTARPLVMVAGAMGPTTQARAEATIARRLGYHAVLLSLAGFANATDDELIAHCRDVAAEMPLMGFYLQPAVGGRVLGTSFWRRLAALDNVVAIKIAPFNRYHTLDVLRGVVAAGAEQRIALYTGNDDNIVLDLLTPFALPRGSDTVRLRIRGGLLGHWSVWTKTACDLFDRIKSLDGTDTLDAEWLTLAAQVTDCNSAVFDVANNFAGCIAGCHEVLRRQGLLEGIECLDPAETLGPGQAAELDRVLAAYPHLDDSEFVRAHRDRWLAS